MITFLSKLNWPSVVLLVAVICAVVVAAALGVSREVLAIISGAGALLTALAPALGGGKKYDDGGNSLPPGPIVMLLVAGVSASIVCGCGGTASRVSTAASCASLMLTIGERADYAPERAVADIDSVAAVCRRLDADAGAP